MTPRTDLQAEGDRDLRLRLLGDHTVTSAIERLTKKGLGQGARRHLLFAWQRHAEISADRAELICAGDLEPAARGLFKLASGLKGDRVRVSIAEFLAQVGDLRREAEMQDVDVQARRGDWFATHPFSPLRLKAAELCAASEVMTDGGTPRATLESEVQELMTLMDPSYLTAKTDTAETMRRLLFAGGVAVASAADGTVAPEAMAELERLLGPGAVPPELKPAVIVADLPGRYRAGASRGTTPAPRAGAARSVCHRSGRRTCLGRGDGRHQGHCGEGRGRPRTGKLCARSDLERVRIVSATGGLGTADLHPPRVYLRITFSAPVENSETFAMGC